MLMVPRPPHLWAMHGARPGEMHRDRALGEAPQFSGTLHVLRGVGRREMRSEDPGFCKWDSHHAGIRVYCSWMPTAQED